MAFRQVMAASLAFVMAIGAGPMLVAQQQGQGTIVGQATDEADSPYANYTVQLVHRDTQQILATQVLDGEGNFSFAGLGPAPYFVRLIDNDDDNELVCEEGPFDVANADFNLDVNIDCGGPPAALYLAAGVAGLVTAIGVLDASESGTGN
ncbi:MAG: carboxypeptidase-like regulatory domain-containing protein [Vicinamibacterales bacterium]